MRRQKIIAAARILFVEHGFHSTGVAQIAKQSGVAVGQIYRDFDGKEDIVAAIVQADCIDFMARDSLHRAIAAGDSAAVWEWICQFLMKPDKSEADPLFAEIVAEAARNDRIASIFSRMGEDVRANMLSALTLLAPGVELEARRALLADLILTQSLGLMQQRLIGTAMDSDALAKMVLTLVEREIKEMQLGDCQQSSGAGFSRPRTQARWGARLQETPR